MKILPNKNSQGTPSQYYVRRELSAVKDKIIFNT